MEINRTNEQNIQREKGDNLIGSNLLRDEFLAAARSEGAINRPGDPSPTVPSSPYLPELSLVEPHHPWSSSGDEPQSQMAWGRAPGGRVYIINKDGTIGFLT